jgi:hypothetical protein
MKRSSSVCLRNLKALAAATTAGALSNMRSTRIFPTTFANMPSIKAAFGALCVAMFLAAAACLAADAAPQLAVTATFVRDRGKPELEFSLRNNSDRAIVIRQTDLPWGGRFSVVLVVVDRASGEPLKRTYPIEDTFGPLPSVTVTPRQSIQGITNLAALMESSDGEGKKKDLILFWYCSPKAESGAPLGTFGGWIEIPRSGK